jgi:hypothetical protein
LKIGVFIKVGVIGSVNHSPAAGFRGGAVDKGGIWEKKLFFVFFTPYLAGGVFARDSVIPDTAINGSIPHPRRNINRLKQDGGYEAFWR